MSATPPCATCPWRLDKDASDIPAFDLAKAEALVETCNGSRVGSPRFACHQSRDGAEVDCRGWLVRYGWDSITVRLALMNGSLDPADLDAGPGWPPIHETFADVIAKLRATS